MWMNPLGRHFGTSARCGRPTCCSWTWPRAGSSAATRRRRGSPAPSTAPATGSTAPCTPSATRTRTTAAWSVFARPLDMLTQDVCNFYGELSVYANYGGIVFGNEEGTRVAEALGKKVGDSMPLSSC